MYCQGGGAYIALTGSNKSLPNSECNMSNTTNLPQSDDAVQVLDDAMLDMTTAGASVVGQVWEGAKDFAWLFWTNWV